MNINLNIFFAVSMYAAVAAGSFATFRIITTQYNIGDIIACVIGNGYYVLIQFMIWKATERAKS